jgi:transcriptional regulator with XRE-family HTH domain
MFDYKAFGKYVRETRKRKGLRQIDFLDRCGISPMAFWRIENAKRGVTVYTLDQIAEALNCDLEIIFKERK